MYTLQYSYTIYVKFPFITRRGYAKAMSIVKSYSIHSIRYVWINIKNIIADS